MTLLRTINRYGHLKYWLTISLVIVMSLFPLLFIILGSSQDSGFIVNTFEKLYFGNNFVENFEELQAQFILNQVIFNSLLVSIFVSVVGTVVIFIAAYAFAIYEFKGKNVLMTLLLSVMLIPGNVLIINKFRIVSELDFKNSYLGLIIPTLINIHIFILLVKNINYLNREVIDSARLDGASESRIMMSIGLPSVMSYLVISGFNLFVQSWNSFLFPLLIINSEDLFTLPIMISSMSDPLRFKYGAVFVGILIQITPPMLLLFFASKKLFRKIN